MSNPATVTIPHYGTQRFDLGKLNQAMDVVLEAQTEEAAQYRLVHTFNWSAVEAVDHVRAAQFCIDNSIDPNEVKP